MTRRISNLIWLAVALACGSALAADEIRWAPDLPAAKQASARFKVPLLIHFYGDNCLPCKTLEERVFTQPELAQTLNRFFICVRINGSRNKAVAAQYNVHRWPTDVFVAPDGSILFQDVCKQDLNDYMGVLHNVAVMNRDRNHVLAGKVDVNANPATDVALQQNSISTPGTQPSGQLGANRTASTQPGQAGFYDGRPQDQMSNHLAEAQLRRPEVATGPTPFSQQMQPLTGATASASSMITGTFQPNFQPASTSGQLPPMTAPAGVISSPASQTAGTVNNNQALDQYAAMPTAGNPSARPASSSSGVPAQTVGWTQPSSSPTTVENPYMAASRRPAEQSMNAGTAALTEADLPSYGTAYGSTSQTTAAPPTTVSQPNTAAQQNNPTAPSPTSAATIPTKDVQPALEGYCVIAAKRGSWVPGKPELAVKHRGQVYWFSSLEAQQRFLASPETAAPVLAGYDPAIFLAEGRLVPGKIQHTLHERFSDQLFLFANEATKQSYYPAGNEQVFQENTRAILEILRRSDK